MKIKFHNEPHIICPHCQADLSSRLLVCPGCKSLVHSNELKDLAKQAEAAEAVNDFPTAIAAWRNALEFLPTHSKQFTTVSQQVDQLSRKIEQAPTHIKDKATPKGFLGKLMGVGAFGALLWKFKFILAFMVTKGKLLLLGFTKAGTLFSMALSFGIYWTAWGWRFALGLILCIYVHEMGHIAALRKLGIKASVPTFIPGIGAVIRTQQMPVSPRENARVGLAGPIWGGVASLILFMVYAYTGITSIGAIAKVSAWINLFNLLPISPLDGGRGFSALSKKGCILATVIIGIMWYFTNEGLLILLLISSLMITLAKSTKRIHTSDQQALVEYSLLVVCLSVMSVIPIQIT